MIVLFAALARQTQKGIACGNKIAVPQVRTAFMDQRRTKWRFGSALPLWITGILTTRCGRWGDSSPKSDQTIAGSTATKRDENSQMFTGGIGVSSGADYDLRNSAVRQIAEQGDCQFGRSFNGSGIGGTGRGAPGFIRGFNLGAEPRNEKVVGRNRRKN